MCGDGDVDVWRCGCGRVEMWLCGDVDVEMCTRVIQEVMRTLS